MENLVTCKFVSARLSKLYCRGYKLLICLAMILMLNVSASNSLESNTGFFSWIGGIWRGDMRSENEGSYEDWSDNFCEFRAVTGRLFNQSLKEVFVKRNIIVLPDDKIKEQFRTHETREWIFEENASLFGVPLSRHEALEHHLVVTLFRANEVLLTVPCTIHVIKSDEETRRKKVAWKPGEGSVQCLPSEPVVTLVISLQVSTNEISPQKRVQLIGDLCAFLQRPQVVNSRTVALETQPTKGKVAFMSGQGNIAVRSSGGRGGVHLSWPVGCGGDAFQLPSLDRVENSAPSGELARALGYDVIEWRVENRKPAAVKIVTLSELSRERNANPGQTHGSKITRLRLKREVESSPGIPDLLTPYTPGPMGRLGENSKPIVAAGMQNLHVPHCNYFEYQVPADAFYDAEDGDVRALKLTLIDQSTWDPFFDQVGDSWMLLDPQTQTLYGVPPRSTESSDLGFNIIAEDSSKQSAKAVFQVNLSSRPRPTNHRFTVYLSSFDNSIVDKAIPSVFARALTQALGAGFDDVAPTGHFTILKKEGTGNEMSVTWFKNDLGNRKKCNRASLEEIWLAMTGRQLTYDVTQKSKVTGDFKKFFGSNFRLKSVKVSLFGPCDQPEPTEKPTTTSMSPPIITPPPPKITTTKSTTTTTTTTKTTTTKKMIPSPPPITPKPTPKTTSTTTTSTTKPTLAPTTVVRKPALVDKNFELIIPAPIGRETRVKIPESKFSVPSGVPAGFSLQPWGDELPLWIAIDPTTSSLVILPTLDDVMALDEVNVTHRVWNGGLVAVNLYDGSYSDRMRVKVVVPSPQQGMDSKKKVNHVFVAKIENYVLENFTSVEISKFMKLIQNVIGDTNSNNIYVLPLQAGSVILSWYNTSFVSEVHCPSQQINSLGQKLLNNAKTLEERLNSAGFSVSLVELKKKNSCAEPESTTTRKPKVPRVPPTSSSTLAPLPTSTGGQLEVAGGDSATGIIIIAVVLVCILVLVAVGVFKCRNSSAARRKRENKKRLQSAAATAAVITPNSPFHLQGNGGAFGDASLHFKPGTPIVLAGETGEESAGTPLLQRTSTFTQGHNGNNRADTETIPLNHMTQNEAEPVRPPPPAYSHK